MAACWRATEMPLSEFDRIVDALTDPVNEAQLEG